MDWPRCLSARVRTLQISFSNFLQPTPASQCRLPAMAKNQAETMRAQVSDTLAHYMHAVHTAAATFTPGLRVPNPPIGKSSTNYSSSHPPTVEGAPAREAWSSTIRRRQHLSWSHSLSLHIYSDYTLVQSDGVLPSLHAIPTLPVSTSTCNQCRHSLTPKHHVCSPLGFL
ncbi:LADA_0A07690g1_1 [Lachancea dasiensis]|uniref:LADA_0A07690g1_1 n=1 Tax=Lachancea dasiensis TaxID=1072105 RepID=A0A1G4IQ01_9SACH|nr:LADA_0A07690g1_1 [Lachancea dasiensis]